MGSKLGDMNREVLPGQRVSQSPEGRCQVQCAAGRVGGALSELGVPFFVERGVRLTVRRNVPQMCTGHLTWGV